MLVDHPMTLTIPVSDLERARSWYEDKLGLAPVQEVPGEALAYRTGARQSLLFFFSDEAGAVEHQLAAWRVDDLAAEVTRLRQELSTMKDSQQGPQKANLVAASSGTTAETSSRTRCQCAWASLTQAMRSSRDT